MLAHRLKLAVCVAGACALAQWLNSSLARRRRRRCSAQPTTRV